MSFIDNINSGLFPFVSVCLCVRFFFSIQIRNESRNKKAVLQAVPPPPTPPTEEAVILRSPHDLGVSNVLEPS